MPQSPASPSPYVPSSGSPNGLSGPLGNSTSLPISTSDPPPITIAQTSTTPSYQPQAPPTPVGMQTHQNDNSHSSLPALRPVFGLSLEDLLKRDGSAIPLVVYQCIQAVDLYGLEVEGIYRVSGSSTHVNRLKAVFDNGIFIFLATSHNFELILHRFESSRFSQSRGFSSRCQQCNKLAQTVFPRITRPSHDSRSISKLH